MSDRNAAKDATFYIQVEPDFNHWNKLVGAKPVRMTLTKPARPIGGTVLVKLTLRIPDSAFLPLRPEAVVVIPEDNALAHPIEVEALHPDADGEGHD